MLRRKVTIHITLFPLLFTLLTIKPHRPKLLLLLAIYIVVLNEIFLYLFRFTAETKA